jgi:superfamily II DNA helicase RecQ
VCGAEIPGPTLVISPLIALQHDQVRSLEQLQNDETMSAVAASPPSLVVIDEAHCVSTWGHDSRPAYAALGEALDRLGRPQTLCLTATASRPVRDDIVSMLAMRDPVARGSSTWRHAGAPKSWRRRSASNGRPPITTAPCRGLTAKPRQARLDRLVLPGGRSRRP